MTCILPTEISNLLPLFTRLADESFCTQQVAQSITFLLAPALSFSLLFPLALAEDVADLLYSFLRDEKTWKFVENYPLHTGVILFGLCIMTYLIDYLVNWCNRQQQQQLQHQQHQAFVSYNAHQIQQDEIEADAGDDEKL